MKPQNIFFKDNGKQYPLFGFNFTLAIILLAATLFLSCKKEVEPVSCFTFNQNSDRVNFIDCSEDATDYVWDFGNGKAAFEANPSYVYPDPGTFLVTQKTISVDRISNSTSKNIVIPKVCITCYAKDGNYFVDSTRTCGTRTRVENFEKNYKYSYGTYYTVSCK